MALWRRHRQIENRITVEGKASGKTTTTMKHLKRSLSTPVWAIEQFRDVWLASAAAHGRAFEWYRETIYQNRPDYSWRHNVTGYHEETIHQLREAFERHVGRGDLEFSNNDDLFLLHLDSKTAARFSAVHKGGFPNLNATKRSQNYLAQGLLFDADEPTDEAVFLVGVKLDPSWESPPDVSVNYYHEKQRVWSFAAEDAAMDEVLRQYRRAH